MTGSLLFLFLAVPLVAQEYSHRVWRTEDGLPQNRIQAISQTKDGYLWIGTSEGLARFDGVRFVVFDQSNTAAFTDNSILSLQPAPDGSLWIGAEGGGLLHYVNGVFRSFGPSDGLTNSFVRAICLSRAGTLWVGTDRGFFQFTAKGFVRFDNTPDIPLASVVSIAEDRSGKIWVASSSGLLSVDHGSLVRATCRERVAASPAIVVSLLREKLIQDGCEVPGIALPDVAISSLHKDSSGKLWIGTAGHGLIRLAGGVSTTYTAPLTLPDNTVFVVFEDRQHNIWAGAQDGLLRLSRTAVTTISARDGLTDDNVSTTYEDSRGMLWIATFTGQVYRFNGGAPERFYLPPPDSSFRIRTIFEDSAGAYWFGTSGDGLVRWFRGKTVSYTRNEGLRSNSIRQVYEGTHGIIWIATASGLSRWDGRALTTYYLEQGLSYPSVRCLASDSNGDILAGTDAGLNRIHNGRIVPDQHFAQLKQEKIWSIHVAGDSLWLGTRGSGLLRYKDGKITRFTTRNGLVSNSVYQIVDDRRGNFWMSSPVGVFSVSREELDGVTSGTLPGIHAVAYGTSDGMETSQMYGGMQPAGCIRSSGELWFPSVRGAVRIDPAHLPERRPVPVVIERVLAGETTVPLSQTIVIPPGRGKLEIDFTAPDLIGPQRVDFTYKLEGFDESWTSASKLRAAYYSNLPPGRYRFRVIATNAGTPGASSEASLSIDWRPAFHQTGWFYALWTAILAGAAWVGFWFYARQTKTRFALLLAERTRVAREMHDTVIQSCVGISTLMDAAARTRRGDPEEAGRLLDHARAQVKATLEEARQAVWDLRHYEDGVSAVDRLIDLAQKLGVENEFHAETAVTGKRQFVDSATDRALLLAGREALRNAVRHGHPSRIGVTARYEADTLSVEIDDNGVGFDSQAALEEEGHFGILGMRERIEQTGGSFTLRSNPGNGATIRLTVPLDAKSDSANALNARATSPQFHDSARQSPPESGR
ncbi:MAG TPA: two-component regulator propeller domain-containing protein [Bryobacteraceae bacterium]|jgi:ligand-binding sensor domain-containing protein/two-component sensor histidine kinase